MNATNTSVGVNGQTHVRNRSGRRRQPSRRVEFMNGVRAEAGPFYERQPLNTVGVEVCARASGGHAALQDEAFGIVTLFVCMYACICIRMCRGE